MKLLSDTEAKNYKYKLTVTLNGTNENPWHRWDLRCNPFPQIAKYEWNQFEWIIAELDGDPIPDVDYIRKKLKGFSPEFVDLCCRNFCPGERVAFNVYFND